MSITFTYTAVNCPTPIQPAPTAIGVPSLPFQQGSTSSWINNLNQLNEVATILGNVGAGGNAVIYGCVPGATSGLNLAISAGLVLLNNGLLEFIGSGRAVSPFQQLVPVPVTLTDNTTNYVWITQNSAGAASLVNVATSLVPPTNAVLCVAIVTTVSGAITQVDQSGVPFMKGSQITRTTADTYIPGDSPPTTMQLLTVTLDGNFLWDGTSHKALVDLTKQQLASINKQTISTTLALNANSANNQYLTASGGNQHVLLPDPTAIPLGWTVALFNAGGSNNLLLYDHTNTTPLATLTPGQALTLGTLYVSGANAFPSGTYTPGTPTAGVPAGPV